MLKTERGYEDPRVSQIAVFLRNRVGELGDVLRLLEKESLTVHALSVADAVDYAVVRLVVDAPDVAKQVLEAEGIAVTESRLLAVKLPDDRDAPLRLCRALLGAEVNIHYAYPMSTRAGAMVLRVDDRATAIEALKKRDFELIDQGDLQGDEGSNE